MATLTPQETKAFVEKLIATGQGDRGRLEHIMIILREGRKLYNSDQKYLNSKLAEEIGLREQAKVEPDIFEKIQALIDSGVGDSGRLQFISESLKQGKQLYNSDQKYLRSKLGDVSLNMPSQKPSPDTTIESLTSQIRWANQKILHLESILSEKVSQLQSEEKPTKTLTLGAMPKGWKTQTIVVTEQPGEKTEDERLRIEQSKLAQIIVDRQEFEKQLQIEQEALKRQIEQEKQNVHNQAVLLAQIRTKEAELEDAKKERDSIASRLQDELEAQTAKAKKIESEQKRLDEIQREHQKIIAETKSKERELAEKVQGQKAELDLQQKLLKAISNYEKYIASSKQKRAVLTAKIESQKKKLQLINPSVSQVSSDEEMLNKITAERIELEKRNRLAELELEAIKKEKIKLERQLKHQKSTIATTKKREIKKIKILKQKKNRLDKKLKKQSVKKVSKK
jgi:DNA repair exonuclease SbcCD ATPase subunit